MTDEQSDIATDTARSPPEKIGYRRSILALGAFWGAVPALSFGTSDLVALSTDGTILVIGALMTVSLGILYELDSRTLAQYGTGVPLAWSYALIAPLSFLLVPPIGVLAILCGPPLSALLYVYQRGRYASRADFAS
ncbi:hypothetical protein [Halostagnicola sp. A56]|uniref:hypothetical protein n=1 Tax=Halostagnicola sp. A56 TaxID=1495067 RepID=UPI0018CF3CEB|nr:hypothetical protein [Halostagnicola sp. A56]